MLAINLTYGATKKFKVGDDSLWSNPSYDDTLWASNRVNFDTSAIFWVRQQFNLIADPDGNKAIRIQMLAAYEVYWDGVLIGKNGEVGVNKKEEIEGDLKAVFPLPKELSRGGNHTLAIRASNFHINNKIRVFSIAVGNTANLFLHPIIFTLLMHLLAGGFLAISIYYLFQFSNNKNKTTLLFGLLCLLFFLLIVVEYLKFYLDYPYSFPLPKIIYY